jgi:hypothetical protein
MVMILYLAQLLQLAVVRVEQGLQLLAMAVQVAVVAQFHQLAEAQETHQTHLRLKAIMEVVLLEPMHMVLEAGAVLMRLVLMGLQLMVETVVMEKHLLFQV